jgi:hypothetical protein
MNRALYILLIPTLIVAIGYGLVLRAMGIKAVLPFVVGAIVLMTAGICWFGRRSTRKAGLHDSH